MSFIYMNQSCSSAGAHFEAKETRNGCKKQFSSERRRLTGRTSGNCRKPHVRKCCPMRRYVLSTATTQNNEWHMFDICELRCARVFTHYDCFFLFGIFHFSILLSLSIRTHSLYSHTFHSITNQSC